MTDHPQMSSDPSTANISCPPWKETCHPSQRLSHCSAAEPGKDIVWEDTYGNELIFALDDEEAPAPNPADSFEEDDCKEHPFCGPSSPLFPLEPDFSPISHSLSPVHSPYQRSTGLENSHSPKPFIHLVKSLSTVIESREGPSLKPQPLLSLVKSISTEISHLEPEVTLSKSDSKLNVHLWRQITQPRKKNGDSRTAPSSPNHSPKGSFFKAQEAKFEDTKRRFSEAKQEPLSRLREIIGDENNMSPKLRLPLSGHQQGADFLSHHFKGSPLLEIWAETTSLGTGEMEEQKWDSSSPHCQHEEGPSGEVFQVVETAEKKCKPAGDMQTLSPLEAVQPPKCCSPVPCKVLTWIAILAYNYLVLPLPPYISGLCLGLGMLPLQVIPQQPWDLHVLKVGWGHWWEEAQSWLASELGWMNEMHFYDPEIYHPSLTHSVFVTLENSNLTLSYPQSSIPRRATFGEENVEVAFLTHRLYDMSGAKVFLFPPGLARKRTWNKKYPICILFPKEVDLKTKAPATKDQEVDSPGEKNPKKKDVSGQCPAEVQERTLYLFGRTGRDKEECLVILCYSCPSFSCSGIIQPIPAGKETHKRSSSSTEDLLPATKPKVLSISSREKLLLDYNVYMSQIIPTVTDSDPKSCSNIADSPGSKKLTPNPPTVWVNAMLGRMFWDFLREKYWADQVSDKIQKKLGRIKLPYFMNELTLTDLEMGTSIPHILGTSSPTVDNRGLWVDMEVTYQGTLKMTLETKMNLYKLGKEDLEEENGKKEKDRKGLKPRVDLLAESDAESSSAGSSEEEEMPVVELSGIPGERKIPPGVEGYISGGSTSRKILRFVDKIAKSKYFQKATENEFIKKKMEEVSNTPLLLTVEVQDLTGTLAVNIPPPPTDRIWYSFRIPPQLDMKVRPRLGEREVTFPHITEWIEKKLQHEFQVFAIAKSSPS
uniref:SMP-LTD domain-containing protein n=1 Tax=Pseudonaja textilis TaxID=8673 RepID=A0A670XTV0_PSETE